MGNDKGRTMEHSRELADSEWEIPAFPSVRFVEKSSRRYPATKQLRQRRARIRHIPTSAWRTTTKTSSKPRPVVIERSDAEVQRLFDQLATQWRENVLFESNVERIILDDSYQRIIGLGPQVVPYILRDLEQSPDHWFWALTAIIGEDKAAGQASIGAAAEAWLAWGIDAGLTNR